MVLLTRHHAAACRLSLVGYTPWVIWGGWGVVVGLEWGVARGIVSIHQSLMGHEFAICEFTGVEHPLGVTWSYY